MSQFDTVPVPAGVIGKGRAGKSKKRKKKAVASPSCKKLLPVCLIGLLILIISILLALIFAVRSSEKTSAVPSGGQSADTSARQSVAAGEAAAPTGIRPGSPSDLAERREAEITELLRLSREREAAKDFAGALKTWQHCSPPPELRDDPIFKQKVAEQIRYLEDRISKQDEDILP